MVAFRHGLRAADAFVGGLVYIWTFAVAVLGLVLLATLILTIMQSVLVRTATFSLGAIIFLSNRGFMIWAHWNEVAPHSATFG